MNITKKTRLAIGVVGLSAAVGLAAGGAFTGTGVTTTGQAAAPQFVGGAIDQAVTGATLDSIAYSFTDTTKVTINSVLLTFTDHLANGKAVTIGFTGGSPTPTAFTCTPVATVGATANSSSTCSGGTATAITSITVTVAS